MIQIVIGPNAIKKEGLDNITKAITKTLYKYTDVKHCHVIFLTGISKGDIQYLIRHIMRILDTALIIETEVNLNITDADADEGVEGHREDIELIATIKVI